MLAQPVEGEFTVDILDAKNTVVRSFTSQASDQPAGGAPRRGGTGTVRLTNKAGLNRLAWDLRASGDASGGRGGGGFLVVPGTYQVRMSVPSVKADLQATLEVRIDPRLASDGVTVSDLQTQWDLLGRIRTSVTAARALVTRLAEAKKAQAGSTPDRVKAVEALEARLVTAGGAYPQPMLIDQFANVTRMISQADQKIGRDAYLRLDDLDKELAAITAEVNAALK